MIFKLPSNPYLTIDSRHLYVFSLVHVKIKPWMHSKMIVGAAIMIDNY